jgi:hypothetical protein
VGRHSGATEFIGYGPKLAFCDSTMTLTHALTPYHHRPDLGVHYRPECLLNNT